VEKLRADTAGTRKRIGNVLDVLHIVAESHANDDANNTVTMTVDGELFALSSDEQQVAPDPLEPLSPVNRAMRRASQPNLLALSPHVTPRTKTRRRLLGSPPAANAGAQLRWTVYAWASKCRHPRYPAVFQIKRRSWYFFLGCIHLPSALSARLFLGEVSVTRYDI
jgi:hypothetical protein